jgi:hypothetical protein
VEEILPTGTAAVLINQSHTSTNIFFPIDDSEMQIYEAIDGVRSVDEILRQCTPERGDRLSDFFQKLWWYDQVSFDTSKASPTVMKLIAWSSVSYQVRLADTVDQDHPVPILHPVHTIGSARDYVIET